MSLLSKRIFFECIKLFFITLIVLMLFVLMGRALQLKDMLLGLEIGITDTIMLFAFLSPTFLLLITPISAMISVFLTFLRMGSDRELIAAKAGGVSLYQLLPAPIFFGLLCTFLSLWIAHTSISWGAGNFRALLYDIAHNRVSLALQAGTFNQDIPNIVFFARQVDTQNGTLAHVMIEDTSQKDNPVIILAPRGDLDIDYTRGEIFLFLENGVMYSAEISQEKNQNLQEGQSIPTNQTTTLTQLSFDEYVVRFSLSSLIKGLDLGSIDPSEMHWNELRAFNLDEIADKKISLSQEIITEQHKRILFPVSCLVLIIFAIPIAVSFQGLQKQVGLIFALVLFFTYYTVISIGMNFVEYNFTNPYLSIWTPVLLFFFVAIYGIHLSATERIPSFSELTYQFRKFFSKKIKTTIKKV